MKVVTRVLAPAAIILLTGCASLAGRDVAMTASERCEQMARAEVALWLPAGSFINCSKDSLSLLELSWGMQPVSPTSQY